MTTDLRALIGRYREDPESVYNTWFINNDQRLKAFRSIRAGVLQVVSDIKGRAFGTDFKGSSLEVVLACITEQKQVFEGAAHPFYWKPKLRIPDIYESEANKAAFGQFLESCLAATREDQILKQIDALTARAVKGLGPAVANILYFLHPTIVPPFNTAILAGYNALFDERLKLGSWQAFLAMRETMLRANELHRHDLSSDLGAIAGLLFEVGSPRRGVRLGGVLQDADELKARKADERRHAEVEADRDEENLHAEMQYHLLKIGRALGYDVAVAANDRSRSYGDQKFSFLAIDALPSMDVDRDTFRTIGLIDVLWLEKGSNRVVSAFEVEKSTSIYSGILRLADLSASFPGSSTLYLVVPDQREKDVIVQLSRPAMRAHASSIRYVVFSELRAHCDAICRFGADHTVMARLARSV